MNHQELRELDTWIASNIFMFYVHHEGKVPYVSTFERPDWNTKSGLLPEYTTNPAAAMRVLEKCAQKIGSSEAVHIQWDDGQWKVMIGFAGWNVTAETLPLAICGFAKALFLK